MASGAKRLIVIDKTKCLKCQVCVKDCVVKVLTTGADGFPEVKEGDERYCLNCQHCMAVCPVGAVECNGVSSAQAKALGPLPTPETMMNLVAQRRSIRQFKDEDVPQETLQKLLESLAWTPTGCNVHNLTFTVVSHRSEMDFFRSEMNKSLRFLINSGLLRLAYPKFQRYMGEVLHGEDVIFRNAPHVIVAASPKNAPCKEADPWIALSYFDLVAQTYGIGTCWSGFAVHAFNWIGKLRKRLGLPKGYRVGAVLLFGLPAVTYHRQTVPRQFEIRLL